MEGKKWVGRSKKRDISEETTDPSKYLNFDLS